MICTIQLILFFLIQSGCTNYSKGCKKSGGGSLLDEQFLWCIYIKATSITSTNTVLYKIMLAWVLEQSPQEPKFLKYPQCNDKWTSLLKLLISEGMEKL